MSDGKETRTEAGRNGDRRRYRKRRRAQLEEETRLRITEAAMELHGSVGPARTTVSAIAERAGVQRGTVYRHFPDEEAIFGACSAHWLSLNPPPDIGAWAEIADPAERLETALTQLYDWYAATDYMLEKTTRDAATVPAMRAPMEAFAAMVDFAAETLMGGRRERGAARRRARAAIGHALAFDTWRSLVRRQGLSRGQAVGLMAGLVLSAAEAGR